MKRARDVRDQLEGLMERVEIQLTSNILDNEAIRKVCQLSLSLSLRLTQSALTPLTPRQSQRVISTIRLACQKVVYTKQ